MEAQPSEQQAAQVVWLSLDPVRCKLDFYPRVIAERIEAAFAASEEQCVLGADFFNATVHFQNGTTFQTTPGQHFGRGGFKQPGYRTVKRVVKEGQTTTILGKRVHGEWRIAEREDEMEFDTGDPYVRPDQIDVDLISQKMLMMNHEVHKHCYREYLSEIESIH